MFNEVTLSAPVVFALLLLAVRINVRVHVLTLAIKGFLFIKVKVN